MARRSFIFCDVCNPMAVRAVEVRRNLRRNPRVGRRISDGRMWFDGTDEEARAAGWVVGDPDGHHICPACQTRYGKTEA